MGICSAKPSISGDTPSRLKYDFFLSHFQKNAGDQVNVLYHELTRRGYKCWYDCRANDLTVSGMKRGISEAKVFLLFLTEGVFTRPFVQMEVRHALTCKRPVLLVHETIQARGKFDFSSNQSGVPSKFRPVINVLFSECESVGWERRGFKVDAVINELIRRYQNRKKHIVRIPESIQPSLRDSVYAPIIRKKRVSVRRKSALSISPKKSLKRIVYISKISGRSSKKERIKTERSDNLKKKLKIAKKKTKCVKGVKKKKVPVTPTKKLCSNDKSMKEKKIDIRDEKINFKKIKKSKLSTKRKLKWIISK